MTIAIDKTEFIVEKSPRALFVVTICAGSFLLFLVQPMIARMALPRLGGAPAVWNSAMLVYQALLLAGYAYAHWLGQFGARRQSQIHLALFALAALMLPIGLGDATLPPDADPLLWVPMLLAGSIGPLFFIVSAQAPLMQKWYTISGGDDPYPLYAASNLGSFGGLIAYPLIVEPFLPVAQQSLLWSLCYVLLLGLIGTTALALPKATPSTAIVVAPGPRPGRATFAKWVLLAAVPSGLMLSTSLHLTTDIVAIPLLWVMPLGLYLLSFSVAFAANRGLATALQRLAPLVLLMAAASAFVDTVGWPFTFAALTLAGLFVIATALHAEMFAQRPDPAHLTQFYLAMSIGGVVGGLFCALLAPLIFNWTFEHPIMLAIAALLIRPAPLFGWSTKLWADRAATRRMVPVLIVAVALLSLLGIRSATAEVLAGIAIIAVALASIGNRITYAAALVALMLCLNGWDKLALSMRPGQMERSFFGVSSIRTDDGNARILAHGTTVHGVQNLDPARETLPTAYYGKASGVGLALSAAPQFFGRDARIGAVGLGAGTMACYAAPGQTWRFYEIDPAVIAIASNPKLFTFLSKCLPDVEIALGDARLTLAKVAPASSDILVIDAFSSDTVPMHLLTREAFGLYRSHIAADGLLLVHISNRYLDLKPVVAAAQRDGWHAVVRDHQVTRAEQERHMRRSLWVALSPDRTSIERLAAASPAGAWKDLPDDPSFAAWTDDYATILPVLKMR